MNKSFMSPIIKSNKIAIDGTFKLEIGSSAAVGSSSAGGANSAAGGGQASARVIETTAEYATIEVVCSCGTVSQIKCNYN